MKSLSLTTPHLLVMTGATGVGKSFFATKFAEMFGAPLVSYEKIRKLISHGSPIYDKPETDLIENLATNQIDELMRTGSTIVVDGGSETRSARQELATKCRKNGYKILFIWVQTDSETAKHRSTTATARSKPAKYDLSQYEITARRFTPPNHTEPTAVISGKHTFATQARTILKKLSQPRAVKADDAKNSTERAVKPIKSDHPDRRIIIR